jgi:hypothetical protein
VPSSFPDIGEANILLILFCPGALGADVHHVDSGG